MLLLSINASAKPRCDTAHIEICARELIQGSIDSGELVAHWENGNYINGNLVIESSNRQYYYTVKSFRGFHWASYQVDTFGVSGVVSELKRDPGTTYYFAGSWHGINKPMAVLPTPIINIPKPKPMLVPGKTPTLVPNIIPTQKPVLVPGKTPTLVPGKTPSLKPVLVLGKTPTLVPGKTPSLKPVLVPGKTPTLVPGKTPSLKPVLVPGKTPTLVPGKTPSLKPVLVPGKTPTLVPGKTPSPKPVLVPGKTPTLVPGKTPSPKPVLVPGKTPTLVPGKTPSLKPVLVPGKTPTLVPGKTPSPKPVLVPGKTPTLVPGKTPSLKPILVPGKTPTLVPGKTPSPKPILVPAKIIQKIPILVSHVKGTGTKYSKIIVKNSHKQVALNYNSKHKNIISNKKSVSVKKAKTKQTVSLQIANLHYKNTNKIDASNINKHLISTVPGNNVKQNHHAILIDHDNKVWRCKVSGLGYRNMKSNDKKEVTVGHAETMHFRNSTFTHISNNISINNNCLISVSK